MKITAFAAGPYQTNCYVITLEGQATVIDPGMNAASTVQQILDQEQASISQVVLTHGHIDHTRDAAAIANANRVPLYIHEADAFMLVAGDGVSEESKILFDAANLAQATDLRFISDADTLTIGGEPFTVRHAPGHSPGCVMLEGAQVVFAGDVLFAGSIGRTDLPDSSPAQMEQSLRNVVLSLDDALQVLPGHGPATTIRAERYGNPFLTALR